MHDGQKSHLSFKTSSHVCSTTRYTVNIKSCDSCMTQDKHSSLTTLNPSLLKSALHLHLVATEVAAFGVEWHLAVAYTSGNYFRQRVLYLNAAKFFALIYSEFSINIRVRGKLCSFNKQILKYIFLGQMLFTSKSIWIALITAYFFVYFSLNIIASTDAV